MAAKGILSVTELAMAEANNKTPVPVVSPNAMIGFKPSPISFKTNACSIILITTNKQPKN
jgi:hypothetical protein